MDSTFAQNRLKEVFCTIGQLFFDELEQLVEIRLNAAGTPVKP